MHHKDSLLEDNPFWYRDAIIYQAHIKAFADSNADGIGDFRGLMGKLDYLQQLGITALWILPFYPSPLRDDGYDIADYYNVNPSYNTLREFKQFLREAHNRGLRVITELVLNHTPRTSTPGSSVPAWPNRGHHTGITTSGATAPRSTKKRGSSFRISRHQTGPGTRLPRPTTGTASTATSPISTLTTPRCNRRCSR